MCDYVSFRNLSQQQFRRTNQFTNNLKNILKRSVKSKQFQKM